MATAVARLGTSITSRYPLGDILAIRLPLLLLLLTPILAPDLLPTSRLLSLAVTACIFVIVANGLHIIFSYAGQLSLAHTTLWGLGAYAAALLVIHYNWPMFALLPVAGLVAAGGAVAIGIPAFRTAGFSFAIITFAFAEIMLLIANNWTSLTAGSTGLTVLASPTSIGSIEFDTFNNMSNFYYLTLAFAYISLIGVFVIRQSNLGRTFIAIRENEELAKSIGMNVYYYKLIAFAISGFFAGVGGVFYLYHLKHIQPSGLTPFAAFFTIQFLLMILIGGRFSMLGPAIGAVVTVFAPDVINWVSSDVLQLGDVIKGARIQMVFGVTLVLTVLFSPHGIVGQSKARFNALSGMLRRIQSRQRAAGRGGGSTGGGGA